MNLELLEVNDGISFKPVDIVTAFRNIAAQENNDEIEHDLMQTGSYYIEALRLRIVELEEKIKKRDQLRSQN
jgi:hypothetical protein